MNKQFKLGDRVLITDTQQVGTIVSYLNGMILVDVEADFELATCDIQNLEHVERYDKAVRLPIFVDYVGERVWDATK